MTASHGRYGLRRADRSERSEDRVTDEVLIGLRYALHDERLNERHRRVGVPDHLAGDQHQVRGERVLNVDGVHRELALIELLEHDVRMNLELAHGRFQVARTDNVLVAVHVYVLRVDRVTLPRVVRGGGQRLVVPAHEILDHLRWIAVERLSRHRVGFRGVEVHGRRTMDRDR